MRVSPVEKVFKKQTPKKPQVKPQLFDHVLLFSMIHVFIPHWECLYKTSHYASGIKQYFPTCFLSQDFCREAGTGPVHARWLHISSGQKSTYAVNAPIIPTHPAAVCIMERAWSGFLLDERWALQSQHSSALWICSWAVWLASVNTAAADLPYLTISGWHLGSKFSGWIN